MCEDVYLCMRVRESVCGSVCLWGGCGGGGASTCASDRERVCMGGWGPWRGGAESCGLCAVEGWTHSQAQN